MSNDAKLYQKIEKISEDITVLKVIAAKQEQNLSRQADDLKVHIKRSELLEGQVELLEEQINIFKVHVDSQMHKELEPLKDHVKYVGFTFKLVGIVAISAGFLFTAIQFFHWVKQLS